LFAFHNPSWKLDLDYERELRAVAGSTLAMTSSERTFDEPVDGVWASDHFGVCADLAVRAS